MTYLLEPPRCELRIAGEWTDVTDDVLSGNLLVGSDTTSDPHRPLPGSHGRMQLLNRNGRWSVLESPRWPSRHLATDLEARVSLGGLVWWTGYARLQAARKEDETVTVQLLGPVTRAAATPYVGAPIASGTSLQTLYAAAAAALAIGTTFVGDQFTDASVRLTDGSWSPPSAGAALGDVQRIAPSVAVERRLDDVDGNRLLWRDWPAVLRLPILHLLETPAHKAADVRLGPDLTRVINAAVVTETSGDREWTDDASIAALGRRPWRALGAPQLAWLDQLAPPWTLSLQQTTERTLWFRATLPLAQPSFSANLDATAVHPGDLMRVVTRATGADVLVRSLRLRWSVGALGSITTEGHSLSGRPFLVGVHALGLNAGSLVGWVDGAGAVLPASGLPQPRTAEWTLGASVREGGTAVEGVQYPPPGSGAPTAWVWADPPESSGTPLELASDRVAIATGTFTFSGSGLGSINVFTWTVHLQLRVPTLPAAWREALLGRSIEAVKDGAVVWRAAVEAIEDAGGGKDTIVAAVPWDFQEFHVDTDPANRYVVVSYGEVDLDGIRITNLPPAAVVPPPPPGTMYTLTITAGANGAVAPAAGVHTYDEGEVVTITAAADSGYQLDAWTGDYTGDDLTFTLTMDSDKGVGVTFEAVPPAFRRFVYTPGGRTPTFLRAFFNQITVSLPESWPSASDHDLTPSTISGGRATFASELPALPINRILVSVAGLANPPAATLLADLQLADTKLLHKDENGSVLDELDYYGRQTSTYYFTSPRTFSWPAAAVAYFGENHTFELQLHDA